MNRLVLFRFFLFLSLFSTPIISIAASGETTLKQPSSSKTNPHPIETKMNLDLFGLLGSGMDYSIDGRRLRHYEDFKRVIYPLKDDEASKLIHDSEENDLIGWIIFGSGIAAGADAALLYKPPVFLNVDWIDRVSTGVFVASIFAIPQSIFNLTAQSEKFNAVQRYNRLIQKQEAASTILSPSVAWDGKDLNLGFAVVF